MGVTAERIAETFPRLYHMAHISSWASISEHGLLSTNALLNLFEVSGWERERLERRHRAQCETLSHHALADAVIRDQKPMSDASLRKCLSDGLTPTDWYCILNRHVFFWPTPRPFVQDDTRARVQERPASDNCCQYRFLAQPPLC